MNVKIKALLSNKKVIALGALFVLYVLSWPLWISEIKVEKQFISGKEVKVYNYFSSIVLDLNSSTNISESLKSFFTKKTATIPSASLSTSLFEEESLIDFAHIVYSPLELIASFFNYKYIGKFYQTNFKELVTFNSSSEEQKMMCYLDLVRFHHLVFDCVEFYEFIDDQKHNKNKFKEYGVKNLLADEFEIFFIKATIEKFNGNNSPYPSNERYYFSFKNYQQILVEASRFSKWFNNTNITIKNPNFDKEFVEKFRAYLKETENQH